MKRALYIFILLTMLTNQALVMLDYRDMVGVNATNIVLYGSIMVLVITEFATRRLLQKTIPGFLIGAVLVLWALSSFMFIRLTGEIALTFIDQARMVNSSAVIPFVLFLLPFLIIDNHKDGDFCLSALLILVSLINVMSLTNLFGIEGGYVATAQGTRYVTALGTANKAAIFLCMLIPFAYYLYRSYSNIILKLSFLAIIAIFATTILMSGSRTAFITLCLVIFTILIITRNYQFAIIILILTPAALFLLADQEFLGVTFERFAMLKETYDVVEIRRLDIWKALLTKFIASPTNALLGTGAGTVTTIGLRVAPHNMYIKILVEFGLVGFAIWASFLLKVLFFVKNAASSRGSLIKEMFLLSAAVISIAWCLSSLPGIMHFVSFAFGTGLAVLTHSLTPKGSPIKNDKNALLEEQVST